MARRAGSADLPLHGGHVPRWLAMRMAVLGRVIVEAIVHLDPARFSLAHGGKDGHPYPVPLRIFDETIRVVKEAVARAKLGQDDKLHALARLDQQARALEAAARGPSFGEFVARERAAAPGYGGRTVFDATAAIRRPGRAAPSRAARGRQLRLPDVDPS